MITLLVADDHRMFRQGIISLLAEEADLKIIAEAANGLEVLHLLSKEAPDILLLDIEMPQMDGFDTLREIKKLQLKTKILALTMHKSPEFIKNIIKSGAHGYLQKDAGKETLLSAIHQLMDKGTYYTNEIAALLIESLQEKQQMASISPREKEVISLIVDGHTTKEIAAKLFLSKHTIESHRQNILLKLGLKNTAELVKYAIQKGLI